MDTMNLKRLDEKHYEIRFAYKCPLSGDKKICKRRFHGTVDEARAERDRLKVEMKSGSEPTRSQTRKLKDYQDSFSKARTSRRGWKAKKATRERDFYGLKHHILPAMGEWYVSEISLADLERVVDHWLDKRQPKGKGRKEGEPYSTASVNQWIKTTRVYLAWCSKLEGIDSPADGLDYLAKEKKQVGVALSPEQTTTFLDFMKHRYPQWYPMCVLGFQTGLRFSSLSALRWEDIDRSKKVVTFYESQYRGERTEGDKMGKIIHLPLTERFEKLFDRHYRWLMKEEHPGISTGLVFPSIVPDGKQNGHLSKSAMRKAMRVACNELEEALQEKDPTATFPRVTPHDMRRTFITRANELQLDPHAIGDATGHSDLRTAAGYDHVKLDRIENALDRVAEGLGF